jgi:hypothetical protein
MVTKKMCKKLPIFQKVAQTVSKPKNAKISTTKLNLKDQNIYIKPLLKPWNTYNKPCSETAYLGENVINLLKQKVDQNVTISLGYSIFSKNHNEPLKVAQLAKNHPIWSPWYQNFFCHKFTHSFDKLNHFIVMQQNSAFL